MISKDGVPSNTHPMNLIDVPEDSHASVEKVTRPPLYEVYMRMAEVLAQVSCVPS